MLQNCRNWKRKAAVVDNSRRSSKRETIISLSSSLFLDVVFFSLQNASVFSAAVQRVKEIGFSALTFFHFWASSLEGRNRSRSILESNLLQLQELTTHWKSVAAATQYSRGNSKTLHFLTFLLLCLSNLHAGAFALCRYCYSLLMPCVPSIWIACWSKANDVQIFCNNDKYFL